MNQSKILVIFFCLFLFTTSAFAFSYRNDLNNGTWQQYDTQITDSGYFKSLQTDKVTFNRGFENLITLIPHGTQNCSGQWCKFDTDGTIASSTVQVRTGTYSMSINNASGHAKVMQQVELAGDTNVIWYMYGQVNSGSYGYVDDQNTYTTLGSYSGTLSAWAQYSMIIPKGKYRFAPYYATVNNAEIAYIDDVEFKSLNTGTFRTNDPSFCGSIASCSNIFQNLPSKELAPLYYTVDFVAGGQCNYRLNKGLSAMATSGGAFSADGVMTEGSTGMYYLNLNTGVDVNEFKDLNIEVYCIKAPLAKKFFVSPRLYRYGNTDNGNGDTTVNLPAVVQTCSGSWCKVDGDGIVTTTTHQAQDGVNAIQINSNSGHPKVYNDFYVGGAEVSWYVYGQASANAGYGYIDDLNNYVSLGGYAGVTYTSWQRIGVTIPAGNYKLMPYYSTANHSAILLIDNVRASNVKQTSSLLTTNTLTNNFGLRGESYQFRGAYKDGSGGSITSASCFLIVSGTTYSMTYDAGNGWYEKDYTFITDGSYSIKTSCGQTSYNDQNVTETITIATPASQIITFTPIKNIASYSLSNFSPILEFTPTNNTDNIEFKVLNNSTPYTLQFNWKNYANNPKKEFSIFTSTDGITWTFSDSLTFGSSVTYNDPIQKIPILDGHQYSFSDTLPNAELKYFRIVLNTLPLGWGTITGSSDWLNVNQPSIYTDANSKQWDVFADSNYTPIRSYTSKNFPDLTSTDLTTGFEIQFTAYAESASNLLVGYTINGTDTTVSVPITTTKTRYSIPADPTSNEAKLLITSIGNNTLFYITDYAIVPKAYFTQRLEVLNNDGSALLAILNAGTSQVYLREAIPYKIRTSAYDREGDLARLVVQASINGIAIQQKEFFLSDATSQDHVFTWGETLEGFIDLNGTSTSPSTFRDIYIKAILYNSANESVSEQSTTVKILQYPFFPQDFSFNFDTTNKKLGKPASFSIFLKQLDPKYLIGFEFTIYDSNHSFASPNFQKTVYVADLKCASLYTCSKEIKFDDYVYETEAMYSVVVAGLFKTENKNYLNLLTAKGIDFPVSIAGYETARVLQVFERRTNEIVPKSYYKPTETVPFVLQMRDDSYGNMENELKPYMKLRVDGALLYNTTAYTPSKFIYDETTGYNYWLFNDLLTDDSGDLFVTGTTIQPIVYLQTTSGTHGTVTTDPITYTLKCVTYPADFFNGSFIMNALGFIGDATFGCTADANSVVKVSNSSQVIDLNSSYVPTSTQNQSVLCLRADLNNQYKQQLGDDMLCVIAYNKSEEMIDGFKVRIGNDNSDYAVTDNTKQYIEFPISGEQVMFNDLGLIKNSLQTEYNTQNIHTYGQLIGAGFQHMLNNSGAQNIADFGSWLTEVGVVQNVGFDLNLSEQFTPTSAHGLFFVRVHGLKVINQLDYAGKYPELTEINPKTFLNFMRTKGEKIKVETTTAYIGNFGSSNAFNVVTVDSPLIIFEEATKSSTNSDGNVTATPTNLKFYFISDLLSGNETHDYRAYVPIWFSYTVPTHFDFSGVINDILYGKDGFGNPAGLFNNPFGWGLKNWFWFVILAVLILFVSYVKKNWGAGGTTVNVQK